MTADTVQSLPVAVLAGGLSLRMGQDKAGLRREGQTLLERTVALAYAAKAPGVVVVGRTRPLDWPAEREATDFMPDREEAQGPLEGIETALLWARGAGHARLCVLACDLPLLTLEALRWLWQADDRNPRDDGLAVTGVGGRIEPLFGIYATRCLPLFAEQRRAGRRSPTRLIEAGDFRRIEAPAFVQTAIADADTPEDWTALTASDH